MVYGRLNGINILANFSRRSPALLVGGGVFTGGAHNPGSGVGGSDFPSEGLQPL